MLFRSVLVMSSSPSKLEESEEEGASSLCKDWRLEPSQNMVIGDKEERLTPSGSGSPEGRWKVPRQGAWCLPLLQEGSVVANEGLLPMQSQEMIFMAQSDG